MSDTSRLQLVGQETQPDDPLPVGNKIATDALLLALRALSQRFVIALSNLFTLVTVASAFVLWYATPQPDILQLIKLGGYGLFVLGINWIIRRR